MAGRKVSLHRVCGNVGKPLCVQQLRLHAIAGSGVDINKEVVVWLIDVGQDYSR